MTNQSRRTPIRRSARRSAPITSEASCARPSCSPRASASAPARSTAPRSAPSRTRRSAASCRCRRRRPARHHRRRVSPHVLPRRFPGAARGRGDAGRGHGEVPQPRRRRRLRAAGDERHRHGRATCGRSSATTSRSWRAVTTKTPKVSIPSPTMLHFRGGRAAISAEAYPISTTSSTTSRPRIAPRSARWRRRLPLPAARRHQPRLPVRSGDAARGARARRRSRRAAAPVRALHQRGDRRSCRRA